MFRFAVWLAVLAAMALPAAAQDAPKAEAGRVVVCPIEGMIDDGVTVITERAVREAEGAQALIFVIDTFGGRVDSAVNISDAILGAPCQTIAFVTGKGAISAGAMIALACHEIVMKPGTNIGAAQPVMMTPAGMEPTGEKELSFVRKRMRAMAEVNGHNPDIAEAMVDKAVVLVRREVDGKTEVFSAGRASTSAGDGSRRSFLDRVTRDIPGVIPAEEPPAPEPEPEPESAADVPIPEGATVVDGGDQLLTLTPNEARDYGLIEATARNVDEVLTLYGLEGAKKVVLEYTWAESLFRFLTDPFVAMLLLAIGIGGLYMEAKAPGFGLPGVVGILCLLLFFGAHYIIGLAEVLDILLVIVGIGLILVEIFLIPGFGLPGVAGIVCVILGIYLSLTNVPLPQYAWDYHRLQEAGISLGGAAAVLSILIAVLWRVLPQTPIYRRVVLSDAQLAADGFTVQTATDEVEAVGLKGTALTVLRPAGRGRFAGRTFNVVSRAEYIEEGTPIVIVEVEGNRYVVDKAE